MNKGGEKKEVGATGPSLDLTDVLEKKKIEIAGALSVAPSILLEDLA